MPAEIGLPNGVVGGGDSAITIAIGPAAERDQLKLGYHLFHLCLPDEDRYTDANSARLQRGAQQLAAGCLEVNDRSQRRR